LGSGARGVGLASVNLRIAHTVGRWPCDCGYVKTLRRSRQGFFGITGFWTLVGGVRTPVFRRTNWRMSAVAATGRRTLGRYNIGIICSPALQTLEGLKARLTAERWNVRHQGHRLSATRASARFKNQSVTHKGPLRTYPLHPTPTCEVRQGFMWRLWKRCRPDGIHLDYRLAGFATKCCSIPVNCFGDQAVRTDRR